MRVRLALLCGIVLVAGGTRSHSQPPPALSSVRGVLLAADEKTPVPGKSVRLQLRADPAGDTQRPKQAQTDDQGRFALERVPEGVYLIGVPEGTGTLLGKQELTIRAARDADVVLVLDTYRVFRGKALDPDGVPLGGADLSLKTRYVAADGGTRRRSYPVTTDGRGEFRVAMPKVRRASLGVRVEGTGWWARPNIDLEQLGSDLGELKFQTGGTLTAVVRNKETGDPIEGAGVFVRSSGSGVFSGSLNTQVKSGADGRIVVDALPPGQYSASPRLVGFLGYQSIITIAADDGNPPEVALEMEPAVRLAGVVLAGPKREPAPGAKVSLDRYGNTRETDANGRFEFPAVRKKTHELTAKLPPYSPVSKTVEAAADTEDIEIALVKEGLRLRGRLIGEDGKPAAGAYAAAIEPEVFRRSFEYRVRTDTFGGLDRWPWQSGDYWRAQADEQGNFELAGLAPGTYHILGMSKGLPFTHLKEVTVKQSGAPKPLELKLGWGQPLAVHGRLTDAEGNPVADKQIRIRLKRENGSSSTGTQTTPDGTYWLRAQDEGTYEIRLQVADLGTARTANVVLSANTVAPALDLQLVPPKYTRADYGAISGVLRMPDGKSPAEHAMVYPYRVSAEKDEDEDAWLEANSTMQADGKTYQSRTGNAAVVAADGTFEVLDLPPGTYGLCAVPWDPSDYPPKPLSKALAQVTPTTVAADFVVEPKQRVENVEIQFGKAGMIRGVVKAADTGEPISNAYISAYRRNTPREAKQPAQVASGYRNPETRSAADGTFALPSLAEGVYSLSVSASDWKGHSQANIEVAAGETLADFTIELQRQYYGAVEGTILLPDGKTPAAGAKVYVGSPYQYFQRPSKTTDAEGKFRLDRLSEGSHSVMVSLPGNAPLIRDVEVKRDEATPVEESLHVGGTVTGTVKNDQGEPVADGAYLILRSPAQQYNWFDADQLSRMPGVHAAKLDAAGRYQLENVAPGKYVAVVWKERRALAVQKGVEVADGADVTVDVAMQARDGVVRGKVTNADGSPVKGGQVMVMPVGKASPMAVRMGGPERDGQIKDGGYEINDLTPGEYWVFCMQMDEDMPRGPESMRGMRYPEKIAVANDAPTEGIDFNFGGGSDVSGVVVDGDGNPVGRARVMSSMPFAQAMNMWGASIGGQEPPRYVGMVAADKDGKFVMPGVPPGDYTFSAMVEDMQHLPGNSPKVTVEAGKPVADLKIEVKRGDFRAWMEKRTKEMREKLEGQ